MNRLFDLKNIFCLCVLSVAFVTLYSSIGTATDTEEKPRLPLAMEVFLMIPHKHQYVIHIHLTNVSQGPVTVDVHDLPWNPPNDSKWLMAFRMDAQKSPMKQHYHLWDFGSQKVRLLPGESIQDKIALNHRLPSLLSDIDQYGVQLYWDCPPPSIKFTCKTSAPQTITIPKGDLGQPDVFSTDTQACRKAEQAIGLINIPQDHEVLFLLTTESVLADLKKVQSLLYQVDDYVRHCQPTWTNSWAVSFFTEEKFAGFLNDMKNERYYEQGLWQQANIGQYSSQIRTLYRFPWIKKKADTVYLSVYR